MQDCLQRRLQGRIFPSFFRLLEIIFGSRPFPPSSKAVSQHLLLSLILPPSYKDTCDYIRPCCIIQDSFIARFLKTYSQLQVPLECKIAYSKFLGIRFMDFEGVIIMSVTANDIEHLLLYFVIHVTFSVMSSVIFLQDCCLDFVMFCSTVRRILCIVQM